MPKTIILTGASSGIGAQAAVQFAQQGHELHLIARRADELEVTAAQVRAAGGQCHIYVCDISDETQANDLIAQLITLPRIDVLINNAGRSIRRPILQSLDRLHDYRRTMEINYFAAVRLTLGLLPRLLEHEAGQVLFSTTQSTQLPVPLFSAYLGSKMALEAFGRSLAVELGKKICVTQLHFPMVRTEMSGRTAIYRYLPMMNAQTAARWMVRAVEKRTARESEWFGIASSVFMAAAPNGIQRAGRVGFATMDKVLAWRGSKAR